MGKHINRRGRRPRRPAENGYWLLWIVAKTRLPRKGKGSTAQLRLRISAELA
ncbi:MAG: hypothetical protein MR913_11600 [Clostridiales bacterium]|nr:hypothetical protein [Clostridiales bacterium]